MALKSRSVSLLLQSLNHLHLFQISGRNTSTSNIRSANAVFVEKSLEVPVIVVTDKKNVDLIGPPDPVSNLRPIVRRVNLHETEVQTALREAQDAVHAWNHEFWSKHNTRFSEQRREFVKCKQRELGTADALTAEQMSEFYKEFLDKNWKLHVNYNMQWYKKNFEVLLLALRASLPPALHFVVRN